MRTDHFRPTRTYPLQSRYPRGIGLRRSEYATRKTVNVKSTSEPVVRKTIVFDFGAWYDAHPDVARHTEMTAEDMDSLYEILTEEETAKYLPAKAGTKEEELEKLISYVYGKEGSTREDVEAICTVRTENKIFDMINAIAEKKQKRALELYYDLLALKEPAMRIMYLITRQFQILMVVKSMSSRGFGSEEIAQKAGCPKWALRKYQGQCRNFTIDQLKQAVKDGADFETAVKTGQMNDQMAVELFIVKYSSVN